MAHEESDEYYRELEERMLRDEKEANDAVEALEARYRDRLLPLMLCLRAEPSTYRFVKICEALVPLVMAARRSPVDHEIEKRVWFSAGIKALSECPHGNSTDDDYYFNISDQEVILMSNALSPLADVLTKWAKDEIPDDVDWRFYQGLAKEIDDLFAPINRAAMPDEPDDIDYTPYIKQIFKENEFIGTYEFKATCFECLLKCTKLPDINLSACSLFDSTVDWDASWQEFRKYGAPDWLTSDPARLFCDAVDGSLCASMKLGEQFVFPDFESILNDLREHGLKSIYDCHIDAALIKGFRDRIDESKKKLDELIDDKNNHRPPFGEEAKPKPPPKAPLRPGERLRMTLRRYEAGEEGSAFREVLNCMAEFVKDGIGKASTSLFADPSFVKGLFVMHQAGGTATEYALERGQTEVAWRTFCQTLGVYFRMFCGKVGGHRIPNLEKWLLSHSTVTQAVPKTVTEPDADFYFEIRADVCSDLLDVCRRIALQCYTAESQCEKMYIGIFPEDLSNLPPPQLSDGEGSLAERYQKVAAEIKAQLKNANVHTLDVYRGVCEALAHGITYASQNRDFNLPEQAWLHDGFNYLARNPRHGHSFEGKVETSFVHEEIVWITESLSPVIDALLIWTDLACFHLNDAGQGGFPFRLRGALNNYIYGNGPINVYDMVFASTTSYNEALYRPVFFRSIIGYMPFARPEVVLEDPNMPSTTTVITSSANQVLRAATEQKTRSLATGVSAVTPPPPPPPPLTGPVRESEFDGINYDSPEECVKWFHAHMGRKVGRFEIRQGDAAKEIVLADTIREKKGGDRYVYRAMTAPKRMRVVLRLLEQYVRHPGEYMESIKSEHWKDAFPSSSVYRDFKDQQISNPNNDNKTHSNRWRLLPDDDIRNSQS